MKASRLLIIALLVTNLSGCFLTKLVTVPMRLSGAGIEAAGAVVSIVPGVGNAADSTLEKANTALDTAADTWDEIPI